MKIAQVSPLIESCPPTLYGGTERIVSYLTEELVRLGHEVTLLASGDSQTAARLTASCPRALRLDPDRPDPIAYQLIALHRFAAMSGHFDVIHFHTDYLHFPFFAGVSQRTLTTMHGRLDLPHWAVVFAEFPAMPLVSISDNQRKPLPGANWSGTVYHGLPPALILPGQGKGGYLAFLGRISPEKRVDRAIEIARRAHIPLRIAAKVDVADRDYFEASIRPLFADPLVEYLGEIGDDQKADFLGNAGALLFPIDWPEPFGLVMIEAMAAGTPVIAFRRGSVPEVVDDGVTGFIVDDMDEVAEAVGRALALDRGAVRAQFERRFTVRRMVLDYLELYGAIAASPAHPSPTDRAKIVPVRRGREAA